MGSALPALTLNGVVVHDRGEMLSLTDMWRAARSPTNREPYNWARKEGAPFIGAVALNLNLPGSQVLQSAQGRGGGTFAHWHIALAYAKYLDHHFHMACNVIIRERMEGGSRSAPLAINVRDPSQLAVIASQLVEVNRELTVRAETAENFLAIAGPKANALDRIADTTGLILPSDAAKALGIGPKEIGPYLCENGWCFRRASGRLAARQEKLNARLLDEKTVPAGEGRTEIQVYITPKGLTRLAQELGVSTVRSPDLFNGGWKAASHG